MLSLSIKLHSSFSSFIHNRMLNILRECGHNMYTKYITSVFFLHFLLHFLFDFYLLLSDVCEIVCLFICAKQKYFLSYFFHSQTLLESSLFDYLFLQSFQLSNCIAYCYYLKCMYNACNKMIEIGHIEMVFSQWESDRPLRPYQGF